MDDKSRETVEELVRWMKSNGVATNQTLIEVLHDRATNHYVEVLVDYSKRRVVGSRGPVREVLGAGPEEVKGRDPLDLVASGEHPEIQTLLQDRVERSGPSLRRVRRLDDGTVFDAVTSGHHEQGSVWAVRFVPVA